MKFNNENTKFGIVVDDWEDAIKSSVSLLEKEGFANENYKYSIIKDIETYGSYIMISPGIVIPHTRPENGALKIGCSLSTIKNEVYFDDNNKDPIKVLLAFTAVDNINHLEMLKKIITVIEEGLVNKLDYFLELSEEEKLLYLNSIVRED